MTPPTTPAPRHQPGSIGDFVERLRPDTRKAFLSLRALALSLGPDVVERVGDAHVQYLRRARPFLRAEMLKARLLAVFPSVELPDPTGRLLRRGEERYVRIEGEAPDAHTMDFVRRAYSLAR